MSVQQTSHSQRRCLNCGDLSLNHDREKVFPEDAAPGRWHYAYWCPDGSGGRLDLA